LGAKETVKIVKTAVESTSKVSTERQEVAKEISSKEVRRGLERLQNPKSISKGLRNMGTALLLFPDPFTGVPGAVMLASSFVLKKKEPLPVSAVARETRKLLKELQSSLG
jgi:hypothetical protein